LAHDTSGRTARNIGIRVNTPRPLVTLDPDIMLQTLTGYDQNAFVRFLESRFAPEAVQSQLRRYYVGTWPDGRTIFWQIDQSQRVRTGKLIRYNPRTGKRDHSSTNWVHAALKSKDLLSDDFEVTQCFFGEHLLQDNKDKTVAILEGEKSALVASVVLPDYQWIACGGKSNLSEEKLRFIKERRIILFPDADSYEDWKEKGKVLARRGYNLSTSDLIERRTTAEQKEAGIDLADFLISLAK
jgi:hypothetical protein